MKLWFSYKIFDHFMFINDVQISRNATKFFGQFLQCSHSVSWVLFDINILWHIYFSKVPILMDVISERLLESLTIMVSSIFPKVSLEKKIYIRRKTKIKANKILSTVCRFWFNLRCWYLINSEITLNFQAIVETHL